MDSRDRSRRPPRFDIMDRRHRSISPDFNWDTVSFWSAIAFAMSGMELVGLMGAEVSDPKRSMPKGGIVSSLVTTVFYAGSTAAMLVLIAPDQVNAERPRRCSFCFRSEIPFGPLYDHRVIDGHRRLHPVRLHLRQRAWKAGHRVKVRRRRWSHHATAILCGLVPPSGVTHVSIFEFKILAGTAACDRVGMADLSSECRGEFVERHRPCGDRG